MNAKLVARVCSGCRRPKGTIAINGAYWHLGCYRKATVEQREAARKATEDHPDRLRQ